MWIGSRFGSMSLTLQQELRRHAGLSVKIIHTRFRPRHLTLVVDSSDRLGAAVARNKGEKASALEVTAQVVATEKNNGELDRPKPEEANKAEKELARSKSKTLDFGI